MGTPLTTMLLANCLAVPFVSTASLMDEVEHHYADSDGVKIHYAALGEGPLVVLIHGFPDFWYGWRHQMEALARDHRVVAMDQRGYNRSDKPEGQENYATKRLIGDVGAVIRHTGAEKATVVGHDWGGFVAWSVAMYRPELVSGLVILNIPHPKNFGRELANNPAQRENSAYARQFQQPDAHKQLSPEILAHLVAEKDADAQAHYVAAFERSSIEAMLHYYTQNYPAPPYTEPDKEFPRLAMPVLQFHGLADEALLASGLNDTWAYVDAPYSLVTIPGAGHWAHHDAPDLLNAALLDWLKRNR